MNLWLEDNSLTTQLRISTQKLTDNFDNFVSIGNMVVCHEHIRSLLIIESFIIRTSVCRLFLFCILSNKVNLGKVENFVMLIIGEFVHKGFHCLLRVETWHRPSTSRYQLISRTLLYFLLINIKISVPLVGFTRKSVPINIIWPEWKNYLMWGSLWGGRRVSAWPGAALRSPISVAVVHFLLYRRQRFPSILDTKINIVSKK